jgi:hypothetical protein
MFHNNSSTASASLHADTLNVARCTVIAAVLAIAGCLYVMVDTLRVHGPCRRGGACSSSSSSSSSSCCDPRNRALRRRIKQAAQVQKQRRNSQASSSSSHGGALTRNGARSAGYGSTGSINSVVSDGGDSYKPRVVKVPTPVPTPAMRSPALGPKAVATSAPQDRMIGAGGGVGGMRASLMTDIDGDDSVYLSSGSSRTDGGHGSSMSRSGSGVRVGIAEGSHHNNHHIHNRETTPSMGANNGGGRGGAGEFVKQRHFCEKSAPFLLFNLSLSVLLLAATFIASAAVVLFNASSTVRAVRSIGSGEWF